MNARQENKKNARCFHQALSIFLDMCQEVVIGGRWLVDGSRQEEEFAVYRLSSTVYYSPLLSSTIVPSKR